MLYLELCVFISAKKYLGPVVQKQKLLTFFSAKILAYIPYLMIKVLGPVVQSVVSLTSSLRVISLTVLADSIHNILIFFAEKM